MWEIESEELDKYEGVHRYMLVHRGVIGRDGHPARYEFTILLGEGTDGESCPHCQQPIQREVTLHKEGHLMHATRGAISPHDLVKEKLAELNAFHGRMDAYANRHKATVYRGPK